MPRFLIATLAILIAAPALAQSNTELMDRISRMERDLNFLQKQVYAGSGAAGGAGGAAVTGAGAAQLEVRLSQIEEQLRAMRGEVETSQFNAGEARREAQKLREDIEYRLGALEQAQSAAAVAAQTGAKAEASTPPTPAAEVPAEPVAAAVTEAPPVAASAKAVTGADFPDSNAAYNTAFKQFNAKNYGPAATQFDAFVKKYPKDPLVSNAYYWLGESYYQRGDFARAAAGFRKGFENNPQGQKAPDNLFKLALSLEKTQQVGPACIVLGQITTKYAEANPRTTERAKTERDRMQCK